MKNLKSIEVEIQNPNFFSSIPSHDICENWVIAALQEEPQDLSIVLRFVDESESQDLNKTYRKKDASTNVLSFPFEEPSLSGFPELLDESRHLGDLVLCEPVILKEAYQQNKNALHHWAHMIVHGTLHLQGYDHVNNDDAEEMESLEIKTLAGLGFDNPYETK